MAKNTADDANTFTVTTRFETLARRPGGLRREEALQAAQTAVEEIAPDFGNWADRELEQLIAAVRCIDPKSPDLKVLVEAVAVHARRVRDVGTTMGYELLTFVADKLCEILEAVEAGAEYRQNLVDCHLEALLLSRQERYRNMKPDQVPELSAGLVEMGKMIASPPIAK
ncbi:MAG TPA: hypothetical protein VFB45_01375 [Pseudolabrys sp.]|nr:hypothetical protein [Pseudolabrys sp.]